MELEKCDIETLWLEICFPKAKSLLTCYVYRPPSSPITWFAQFEAHLEVASSLNCEITLLGDFNIDLVKPSNENVNKRWNEIIQLYGFNQTITESTRVTNHIYVSDNTRHVLETWVPKLTISDHYAVCFSWKRKEFQNNDKNNNTQKVISYRNVLIIVPDVFMDNLTELINGHEASSVDLMVEHLTNVFLETIDKHAPLKNKRVKRKTQPIWFNRDIQKTIVERDKAKRNKNFTCFKELRNKVFNMVKQSKSEFYIKAINDSKGNSKMLWQNMKELTGKAKKKSPKVLIIKDQIFTEAEDIANELNSYFTSVAKNILKYIKRFITTM